MIDKFIIGRLKVIEQTMKRNAQVINGELTGKSVYVAPQYSFKEVLENYQTIVAELQDIILYEASDRTQPTGEHDGYAYNSYVETYRKFGHNDEPNGINGTITAFIKQLSTELLQARNCMNRVHFMMYAVMGVQGGHEMATGESQPQIFVDGMNKAFNLFEATRKALTEAVDILCNMINFTPTDPTEKSLSAIGGEINVA